MLVPSPCQDQENWVEQVTTLAPQVGWLRSGGNHVMSLPPAWPLLVLRPSTPTPHELCAPGSLLASFR